MKHAVIVAHPTESSFTMTVARAYTAAVTELGQTAIVRDLYRLGFDPCLKAQERPDADGYVEAPDVHRERELLADCDVFAFVYPIWFGTPPAMTKGYVERVFNHGFAFNAFHAGHSEPLLTGRRLISFTSSGATNAWLDEQGQLLSLRTLFDDYIARVCGMTVVDHVHFPSMTHNLDPRWVEENLARVRDTVRKQFTGRAAA